MTVIMIVETLAVLAATLLAFHVLHLQFLSPIRDIPGPFLAKFTDLWRLLDYYGGTQIETQRKLHEKFGPAVRIGPNMISLSDPSLLKTVYSTRGEYTKSDFYSVNDALQDGNRIQNIFSARDKDFHATYLRPIQKLFGSQHILSMEHLCSKTIVSLCQQLESRFMDRSKIEQKCDLAEWIEYSSWDMDGEMTFSQEMGFLKTGSDHNGIIRSTELCQQYFGVVGQMPWIDMWLGKNTLCPIKFSTFAGTAEYCVQRMIDRVSSGKIKDQAVDFLDHYLKIKELYPGVVTDNEVIGYIILNVLAGADTTAIVIKAIIYHVLANPSIKSRLRDELDAAQLSFPATVEQTKDLPYLDAVVREGMRIHPVLSGILERIVPTSGLTLPDGRYIAPGTIVGMNAWVIHRNKDIYGQDADSFRPERWLRHNLETQEGYKIRVKLMKDSDFTFGAGNRVCIGKFSAQMQVLKTVATLFSRYDIELVPGLKQWTTRNWWFTFTDNIHVNIKRREGILKA